MPEIAKVHGLGNDFVIVRESELGGVDMNAFAKKVCDRKLSVGGDGILVVCPSQKADIRMRIFNADGSEAEMCGNGIRCFAKYVYEKGIVDKTDITVETLAGIMAPGLTVQNGVVTSVKVDMGEVFYKAEDIPVLSDTPQDFTLDIEGREVRICSLLVGVPHAVIFSDDIETDVLSIGPLIEKHEIFPKNTNVNFVRVIDKNTIDIKTWERGAGPTLACGTGSCCAAVASKLRGFTGDRTEVRHAVGSLLIEIQYERVYMSGPAETVFEGSLSQEV